MANSDISVPYNHDLKPLEELLGGVHRPGDFFAIGSLDAAMPRVDVEGVGVLSFPVPEVQIRQLIQHAARAPYGRGEETILDEAVRKVWQLPANRVRIGGKSWENTFSQILSTVTDGLGCAEAKVSAELYKLLVYDPGGFFRSHRDSEKAVGMFGTLIVVLPSAHRGGELILRHAGREIQVDLSSQEVSELRFTAFYADCEHTKIAWLLEHQYSPAGLSFAGLKGKDAALAKVLGAAAERASCVVHLGIVHIEESGPAQPVYDNGYGHGRGRRWGRYYEAEAEEDVSSDSFEVIEVSDRQQHIDQWMDAHDRPVPYGKLPLEDGEVLPAGALDDEDPDEQRLTEATGNEGASFERSYHRAAFLLARSENPPSPPNDWRQPVTISCKREDCQGLQKFALDPVARVARFRVRQDRRQHLHGQIESHGLDMTHVTERKGSPQTLVCTKTRQNHRRQCEQHQADCESMGVLVAALQPVPPQCSKLMAHMVAARELKPRPCE